MFHGMRAILRRAFQLKYFLIIIIIIYTAGENLYRHDDVCLPGDDEVRLCAGRTRRSEYGSNPTEIRPPRERMLRCVGHNIGETLSHVVRMVTESRDRPCVI